MASAIDSFINSFNSNIPHDVRMHLKNVYACLTMSLLAATAGAWLHMAMDLSLGGIVSVLGGLGCVLALHMTPDDGKNLHIRIGYLLGFALCTGIGMGPLLDVVIGVDPSIVMTAFLATTLVFVSFTISAMLAQRGTWLYISGTLMTLLSTMLVLSIGNLFFGSYLLYQAHVYLGLALMCGFVLYDTQLIMEKRRRGDKDFVAHSVDLFIDFIGIFRRLLIILTQKEKSRKNRD